VQVFRRVRRVAIITKIMMVGVMEMVYQERSRFRPTLVGSEGTVVVPDTVWTFSFRPTLVGSEGRTPMQSCC